jgi:hypothetical protein
MKTYAKQALFAAQAASHVAAFIFLSGIFGKSAFARLKPLIQLVAGAMAFTLDAIWYFQDMPSVVGSVPTSTFGP